MANRIMGITVEIGGDAVSTVFNGIVNAVKGAMTNVLSAVKTGFSTGQN